MELRANGFQTSFKGLRDIFLVELNPSLSGSSQLTYASYFGGGGGTLPGGGAFLKSGVVAIAGNTESGTTSNPGNIPLTANAYQSTNQADPTSSKGTGYVAVVDLTKTGTASLIFTACERWPTILWPETLRAIAWFWVVKQHLQVSP
jgi:hypothetical protein